MTTITKEIFKRNFNSFLLTSFYTSYKSNILYVICYVKSHLKQMFVNCMGVFLKTKCDSRNQLKIDYQLVSLLIKGYLNSETFSV